MNIDVKQMFADAGLLVSEDTLLAEAQLLEESFNLIEEALEVKTEGDASKAESACNTIIKHLGDVAAKVVKKVEAQTLKTTEIKLVSDILTKCTAAKVFVRLAMAAAGKGDMSATQSNFSKAYDLLKKSNFSY